MQFALFHSCSSRIVEPQEIIFVIDMALAQDKFGVIDDIDNELYGQAIDRAVRCADK